MVPGLEPFEREDAGDAEIAGARLAAPPLAGRLAAREHGASGRARADPGMDPVPPGRRPVRALLAADPLAGGRDGRRERELAVLEQVGTLVLDVHEQEPRRQLADGRAGAAEGALRERQDLHAARQSVHAAEIGTGANEMRAGRTTRASGLEKRGRPVEELAGPPIARGPRGNGTRQVRRGGHAR